MRKAVSLLGAVYQGAPRHVRRRRRRRCYRFEGVTLSPLAFPASKFELTETCLATERAESDLISVPDMEIDPGWSGTQPSTLTSATLLVFRHPRLSAWRRLWAVGPSPQGSATTPLTVSRSSTLCHSGRMCGSLARCQLPCTSDLPLTPTRSTSAGSCGQSVPRSGLPGATCSMCPTVAPARWTRSFTSRRPKCGVTSRMAHPTMPSLAQSLSTRPPS